MLKVAQGLNVAVIVTATKIENSVDTVINVKKAFNKLGMELTTSAGEEDKREAVMLIVIQSITIGFNIYLLFILYCFWLWLKRNPQDDKIKFPFAAIGGIQICLLVVTSIFVHIIRPSESSEINKTALLKSLHDNYRSDSFPSPGNAESDQWNEIFIVFKCCAVNAVKSTTNDFDLTPWCTTSGSCQQTNSQIPKTCCKGVDKSTYISASRDCHEYVNSGSYQEKGCAVLWSNAVDNLEDAENVVYFIGIAAASLLALSSILFQSFWFVVCFKNEANKVKSDIKEKKVIKATKERKPEIENQSKKEKEKVNRPEGERCIEEESVTVTVKFERKKTWERIHVEHEESENK